MPDTYTKEQIAYVKKRFTRIKELGPGYMNEDRYDALALLSALSTAEQERDALKARCAELEARLQGAADRAIAWCDDNMNDPNDITNPPQFGEYDATELRATILDEKKE